MVRISLRILCFNVAKFETAIEVQPLQNRAPSQHSLRWSLLTKHIFTRSQQTLNQNSNKVKKDYDWKCALKDEVVAHEDNNS
ncbi:hypothetical protein AXX17_AT2G15090 [Arabidopsis thaliana]|uniref:Uncharacterized protein n=1 Tax=Arabidopsis thaliana TaxID=3702 RepID=A0A178VWH4_ARATH|nr:hypothetical protein AXX17_AT2G15090 [Arabidopsis thaliana]